MTAAPQRFRTACLPLAQAADAVAARLSALAKGGEGAAPLPEVAALADAARIFALDPAATAILLVAAAAEIAPAVSTALAALEPQGAFTPALAARVVGEAAAARALAPAAPLRHWRLVALDGAGPRHARPIVVDERVLAHLEDQPGPDPRLSGLIRSPRPPVAMPPAAEAEAARLGAALARAGGAAQDEEDNRAPVLLLNGADSALRAALAAAVAAQVGLGLMRLDAGDLAAGWSEREATALLLDRELALSRALLLIEMGDGDAARERAMALVDRMQGLVALSAADCGLSEREPVLRADLPAQSREARREVWRAALGAAAPEGAGAEAADRLAAQFALGSAAIRAVAAEAPGAADPARSLWAAARRRARGPLDGLAERIETRVGWDDLVLPDSQRQALEELAHHPRQALRVHADWGWAAKGERGLGTAALFAGPSGTGKTLAAEVLAGELALDLYRIDLSQVVSKYIGETEKNLSRIFAAAETGGAILLFDEADALFGKRSEVKDSHDRYANVEVSYLLQRMEAYRGLAILTTNQRAAVDRAFLRRLRQVVVFPFPDAAARAEIWARVFPPETPLQGIAPDRLARLGIAGGAIRSVALNAAFLAAAEDGPVRPEHVLRAARREYAKLEKPFTATEAEVFR